MSLVLAAATGMVFAAGTWLLLQRRLSRIVMGIALFGNGSILVLLQSGNERGVAPLAGSTGGETVADPLPQALALTAIVISFGVTTFLLALAFRMWQLTGDDMVEDDVEDRRIASQEALLEEEADASELVASYDTAEDPPVRAEDPPVRAEDEADR